MFSCCIPDTSSDRIDHVHENRNKNLFPSTSEKDVASTRKRKELDHLISKAQSISSPMMKSRKTILKKVRFEGLEAHEDCIPSDVQVRTQCLSDDECKARWIQYDEYKEIRLDALQTLMELKKCNGILSCIDPNQFCFRGLEKQITVYLYRESSRFDKIGTTGVIEFYKRQKEDGVCDPEILRIVSITHSQRDQDRAWKLALIDAMSY